MSQYRSGENIDFSHCDTWFPASNGSTFPGVLIRPPTSNSMNQSYVIDTTQNNWRAIRVINDSDDFVYGEFVNHNWTQSDLENPWFYEFYDLSSDPWQMNNTYALLNDSLKQELHQLVMSLGECQGLSCP